MKISRRVGIAGLVLTALLIACAGGPEEPYTTESGLTIQIMKHGRGRAVISGQRVVLIDADLRHPSPCCRSRRNA